MRKYSWLVLALMLAACGGGDSEQARTPDDTEEAATTTEAPASGETVVAVADGPVARATRAVACGCSIEEVGACGNYVEIGDRFVEIANWEEVGLGAMEWCGQEGVHAETAGEVKDGKFYATTVAVHSH
jgi:hypothetical protein